MSEIVVPCFGYGGYRVTVLDIDSPEVGTFDDADKAGLEQMVKLVWDGDNSKYAK